MIDYRIQAEKILKLVGGCENVISLSHCFTRLRFVLKNPDAVQEEELRKLESVRGKHPHKMLYHGRVLPL